MKVNNIKAIKNFSSFRIYINDILHLQLLMDNHDGLQSWHVGKNNRTYIIEFYRKKGEPILLEYDKKEKWETILKLIDENI